MKKILIITFLLFCINLMQAQYIPINMEYKVENSSLIIEGEVISQNSYLGSDNEIYTENIISIKNVFKGELNTNLVAIITMGCIVDDISVTWTHLPTLSIGDLGTFFLRSNNRPTNKFDTNVFCIFSGDQGVYLYKKAERKIEVYSILEDYSSLNQFYAKVGLNSMHEENLRFLETENCLNFEIKLGSNSSELRNTINFDLLIYTDSGSYVLNQAESFVGYSSDWFTQNIISNGLLTFQSDILLSADYDFLISDFSATSLHILLQKNNSDNYLTVSSSPTKIASFTIDVASISSEDPFWEEDRTSQNTYIEDGNIENFLCNNFSLSAANCGMIINSLSPTIVAAGVGEWSENDPRISGTVTIYGDNFLTDHGTIEWDCTRPIGHYVQFETIDGNWISPLEGDYLYYTDDEIKVKVPTVGYKSINKNKKKLYTGEDLDAAVACTGTVKVCKPGNYLGSNCGCHVEKEGLYVKFAARNHIVKDKNDCKRSEKWALGDFNDIGGYTWRINGEFNSISGSVEAFRRALTTWRCSTRVNFVIDEVNSPVVEPGFSEIGMKAIPLGTNSVTRGETGIGGEQDCYVAPEAKRPLRHTLFLNSNITWHTGIDMPSLKTLEADMETVLLHELGHAHLLLHTCNTPNVMVHPSSGPYKRSLTQDDFDGGNHLSILSSNRDWCEANMTLISLSDCNITPVIEIENNQISFSIYPNPSKEKIIVKYDKEILNAHINIISTNGQICYSSSIQRNTTEILLDIQDLSFGIYYISIITSQNNYLVGKFIKQ